MDAMRATVFHGPGDVRVEEVPDPRIEQPTDAIVRVTHACICGSDLWPYRGYGSKKGPERIGHEWLGVVTDVGSEVRTVQVGDTVLAPFSFSDGTCEYCRGGLHTSCRSGGFWGSGDYDGGQGEAVRTPHADGTLVVAPPEAAGDAELLRKLLPVTDVLSTGHHAAVAAQVVPGATVAVIGDGAVGLCGVLAAARLKAGRIIALGHHEGRLELARRFGATDVVTSRGKDAISEVRDLTDGGAPHVLECVGAQSSLDTAFGITRDGGTIGYVGVPAGVENLRLGSIFGRNISLRGGVAPARAYMEELMTDVIAGTVDPSPVFDLDVDLAGVPDGYAAMDERRAIKVLVQP